MPNKITAPLLYFGGKSMLSGWILKHIPNHMILTYVDVFGGGGSILLYKDPSPVEVYNDIDGRLVNFFRVLRTKGDDLIKLANLTPYSVEEYYNCVELLNDGHGKSDVEMAWAYFVANRMAFSGKLGAGWGHCVRTSSRGMSANVAKWLAAIDSLPDVVERLRTIQVENEDFRYILEHYDTDKTLFYLDPPYYGINGYDHNLSVEDHEDLVDYLLYDLEGMAVLSGYDNPLYDELLDGDWMRVDKEYTALASRSEYGSKKGKKDKRVESLWLSPQVADWVEEQEI